MKKMIAVTVIAGLASAGAQTMTPTLLPTLGNVEFGLRGGFDQGLSGGVTLHVRNVSGPLGVRLSADYSGVDDALNDNAAFIPGGGVTVAQRKAAGDKESGTSTTIGLDATYDLPSVIPNFSAYAYGGVRYNNFSATLDQTSSGSGKVTYSTNQLGLGIGAVGQYALSPNLSAAGDLGVDYYFPGNFSSNQGGTSGTGDTFKPGEGGYSDVNTLVNQPTTNFKAKIGVVYKF